jgi:large subunit ribosomal protein L3
MTIGILGKKLGMTQLFEEDGTVIPVTVIQAGPCKVLQVKTKQASELPDEERTASTNKGKKSGSHPRPRRDDGYYGVQIGFEANDDKHSSKAQRGHSARSGSAPMRFVRELRYDAMPPYKQGDDVKVDALKDIKHVDITGVSKGCGHSGTIKRHNFARQSTTHGNSKSHRRQGGIGRQYSTAKGVTKGKKMPGHMGTDRVTVQNLELVRIDEDRNLLFVRGAVPGKPDGYLMIRQAVKKRSK